jgi:hypothetical protein
MMALPQAKRVKSLTETEGGLPSAGTHGAIGNGSMFGQCCGLKSALSFFAA